MKKEASLRTRLQKRPVYRAYMWPVTCRATFYSYRSPSPKVPKRLSLLIRPSCVATGFATEVALTT